MMSRSEGRFYLLIGFLSGIVFLSSCGSSGAPAIAAAIGNAIDVLFDGGISGITGTNIQDAIDEVDARIDTLEAASPYSVAMNWKGPWQVFDYIKDDSVSYDGSAYICILNTTLQQNPSDIIYWNLLAEKGADGAEGPVGAIGPQGNAGAIGPQGEKGDQGLKGDQGNVGDQGLKGDKGDQGNVGDQGLKGDKGDQGDVGPEGPAGTPGDGVPSGFSILGSSETPPTGYTYSGETCSPDSSDNWVRKSDMINGRSEFSSTEVNGMIYAIGGNTDTGYANFNEMYNPVTDSWAPKANLSVGSSGHAIAAYNGKIYIFGGEVAPTGAYRQDVDVYDIESDTWTNAINSFSQPGVGMTATTVGDKIYIIGGYNGDGMRFNRVYLPQFNTWEAGAQLLIRRYGHTAVAVGNTIYILGGTSEMYNRVRAYDTLNKTWTTKAPMGFPEYYGTAGAIDGLIYLPGTPSNIGMEIYSPDTDSYQLGAGCPYSRSSFGCTAVEGKIFLMGGSLTSSSNMTHEYSPSKPLYIHLKD